MDKLTPRQIKRIESDNKILTSALEVFCEKGYTLTTLSDIATKAGVSQGLVSQRFQNKVNLYCQIIKNTMVEYISHIDKDLDVEVVLSRMIENIEEGAKENDLTYKFLSEFLLSKDSPLQAIDLLKDLFYNSVLFEYVENAINNDIFVSGEPFEVFSIFIRTVAGIVNVYKQGNVKFPSTKTYLHLILKDKRDNKGLANVSNDLIGDVVKNLYSDYDYVGVYDVSENHMTTCYISEFLNKLSPTFRDFFESPAEYMEIIKPYLSETEYDRMCSLTKFDYIYNQLQIDNEYNVTYNVEIKGEVIFYQVRYSLINRQSNKILVALHSIKNTGGAKEESKRQAVLASLSEDFDYIAHINLRTGEILRFKASEVFIREINLLDKTLSPIPKLNALFKHIVHEADFKKFDDETNRAVVIERLSHAASYKVDVRFVLGNEIVYYRVKFAKDFNDPNSVVVGFVNIDNQVRSDIKKGELKSENKYKEIIQEKNTLLQENIDFTSIFLESFVMALYINLNNNSYVAYRKNALFQKKYVFYDDYLELANAYIENDVFIEDKDLLKEVFNTSYIKSRILKESKFEIMYRDVSQGSPQFCKLQFIKGIDDSHVACSISNVESSLREGLTKEENELHLLAENNEIINILASEYVGLYYVNLGTGDYKICTLSNRIKEDTGKLLSMFKSFSDVFNIFVINSVHPDDQKLLFDAYENVKLYLKNKKSFSVVFRRNFGGKYYYCEMNVIKSEDVNEEANVVTVGFLEKDAFYRKKYSDDIDEQRRFEVIKAFIAEFTSVYYLNPEDNYLFPYKTTDRLKNLWGGKEPGVHYSKFVKALIDAKIVEDDKLRMSQVLNIENILSKLKDNVSIEEGFTDIDNVTVKIKFVRTGVENKSFVMAFRIVNEQNDILLLKNRVLGDINDVLYNTTLTKDIKINKYLEIINSYYDGERVYIFEYDYENNIAKNTFEYCRNKEDSQIANFQRMSMFTFEGLNDIFYTDGEFSVSDKDKKIKNLENKLGILEMQGLNSLIAVPLIKNNKVMSFICIDNPNNNLNDLSIIKNIFGVISNLN